LRRFPVKPETNRKATKLCKAPAGDLARLIVVKALNLYGQVR